MTKTQTLNDAQTMRMLTDVELDAVIGGSTVQPGYGPLGTHLNVSPFSVNALLDPTWAMVGLTGHL